MPLRARKMIARASATTPAIELLSGDQPPARLTSCPSSVKNTSPFPSLCRYSISWNPETTAQKSIRNLSRLTLWLVQVGADPGPVFISSVLPLRRWSCGPAETPAPTAFTGPEFRPRCTSGLSTPPAGLRSRLYRSFPELDGHDAPGHQEWASMEKKYTIDPKTTPQQSIVGNAKARTASPVDILWTSLRATIVI